MTSAGSSPINGAKHPDGAGQGLYVIGMHRSGTSAVTGIVSRFGIHGPPDEDLFPTKEWNEQGNHESATLTRFNEALLSLVGGDWSAPPVLAPNWESDPAVAGRREKAGVLIERVFGRERFVWKDPRNCLLLPFWRSATAPPRAAIFVYRDPLEVANSITARAGFSTTLGVALWERYVRGAVANLDGVPTLVVGFDRVLEQPDEWQEELVEFLTVAGLDVEREPAASTDRTLDRKLRHHQTSPSLDPKARLHDSQRQLLDVLDRMQGPHHQWSAPELGDEPGWVEDVLTLRREYVVERRKHRPSTSPMARTGHLIRRVGRRLGGGAGR
ncbi:MAG: hypothetical protein WBG41_16200 [Acidimicrobiales bacterium]